MPYEASSVSAGVPGPNGPQVVLTITENDVEPGAEWSVEGLPSRITILRYSATRTDADLSTTLQPALGSAEGWAIDDRNHLLQYEGVEARVNDYTAVRLALPKGVLHGRSTPDAHANQVITEISYLPYWVL